MSGSWQWVRRTGFPRGFPSALAGGAGRAQALTPSPAAPAGAGPAGQGLGHIPLHRSKVRAAAGSLRSPRREGGGPWRPRRQGDLAERWRECLSAAPTLCACACACGGPNVGPRDGSQRSVSRPSCASWRLLRAALSFHWLSWFLSPDVRGPRSRGRLVVPGHAVTGPRPLCTRPPVGEGCGVGFC